MKLEKSWQKLMAFPEKGFSEVEVDSYFPPGENGGAKR